MKRYNMLDNTLALLGEAVAAGRFDPDGVIPPESQLCEEYGVSRTVVREAVKSLVAKGMVSTGPKVGTRVLPRDTWNWFDPDVIRWQSKMGLSAEFLRDLHELRRLIEPAAVRMAAERATAEEIQDMERAFEGMQEAVQFGGDYVKHDLRFHQGLLKASHNSMLIQMSKALAALLQTSFEISTTKKDGPRQSLPLHRAVLDAVAAGQPQRAEKAILRLIDGAKEDIDNVLQRRKLTVHTSVQPRAVAARKAVALRKAA
jgi:DNA-binding FadR family transcriptional regulator